jgi:hypothetical protein
MKAKEKAEELVNKFYEIENNSDYFGVNWKIAKRCALIAVDEIINYTFDEDNVGTYIFIEYLLDVKQEIEKL